jgi:hypothetical protein
VLFASEIFVRHEEESSLYRQTNCVAQPNAFAVYEYVIAPETSRIS